MRLLPPLLTVVIFALILRRIPAARLVEALGRADIAAFLLLMIPNSVIYFAWDTFLLAKVIGWFHGRVRYSELLPVRAVSYVVALLQTQVAQFSMALYLRQKLQAPFLRLAGTVLFITLVEITHLALWAAAGMLLFRETIPRELFIIPAAFAGFWALFVSWLRLTAPQAGEEATAPERFSIGMLLRPGHWEICRTFVHAPPKRYAQFIALRAPLFFLALVFHWQAVRTFGMEIPFPQMLAFLPIIFVIGAVPLTVGRLGTTQAAWIFFFSPFADPASILAYSLAAHATFMLSRGALGLLFVPRAYRELAGVTARRVPAQESV